MSDRLHVLDARGLHCPLPIVRAKKALAGLQRDEILEVTATDPGSMKDLAAFCRETGHPMLSSQEVDGEFRFQIRKT